MSLNLRTKCILSLVAFGVLASSCSEPPVTPEPVALSRGPAFAAVAQPADNHLILTSGPASAGLSAAVASRGGHVEHNFGSIGVLSVAGLSDAAAAQLRRRGDVKGIERDQLVQWVSPSAQDFAQLEGPAATPSAQTDQSGAFFFNQYQWNMRQIDAPDAWRTTDQGEGALVCILDTGVDPLHIDLRNKVDLAKSRSFVPSEPFIEDLNFHGTFVSALVSSNGLGMASVAPDARLCAVKVLNRFGSGEFDWMIAGIMHATDVRADVINLSLGAYFYSKSPEAVVLLEAIKRALEYASNRGTLVVAASGNGGLNLDNDTPDFIHAPSQMDKVVSVGATGPFRQQNFDQRAGYSNHGTTGVDMVAPGGNRQVGGQLEDGILSACSRFVCGGINFYLAGLTGTSFSAPHVSGAAAVFATNTRATGGDNTDLVKRYDARFLEGCLEKGLDKVEVPNMDITHGKGRLNVERSMLCGSSPK